MAVAIAIPYPARSPARERRWAVGAPSRSAYPRVYSPFGRRRLARPMALPLAAADAGPAAPPGRLRLPFVRFRRGLR